MTYEIRDEDGTKSILCLLCQSVSTSSTDVLQRYCPKCDRFHGDAVTLAITALSTGIRYLRPDLGPATATAALARLLEILDPKNLPPQIAQPQWSDAGFAGKDGGLEWRR